MDELEAITTAKELAATNSIAFCVWAEATEDGEEWHYCPETMAEKLALCPIENTLKTITA